MKPCKLVFLFVLFFQVVVAQAPKTIAPPSRPLFPSGITQGDNGRKEIKLGCIAPLSGGIKQAGDDLFLGMDELVFSKVNQAGGINGYRISLNSHDSEYDVVKVREGIDELLQKTSIFFGVLDSAFFSLLSPKIISELLIFFPTAGYTNLNDYLFKNIFPARASTAQEIHALLNFMFNKLEKRQLAVFYEDSIWGRHGLYVVKKVIENMNKTADGKKLTLVSFASYPKSTVNIDDAVKKIKQPVQGKYPDTVLCIGHSRPVYAFIKKVISEGLHKSIFLGVSETSLMQQRLQEDRGYGIYFYPASPVPHPWKSKLPIATEYRKAMKLHERTRGYSVFSFQGFIFASLFVELIKKIKGIITKRRIQRLFRQTKAFTFKGFPVFNRKFQTVWINRGKERSWLKYQVPNPH